MNTLNIYTEKLFSYGTLQFEAVQVSTFGRKLNGKSDALSGYKLSLLKITDPKVIAVSGKAEHPILTYTGNKTDKVTGTVFAISPEELAMADKYEVADYKRIHVQLYSGTDAWIYVNAN